VDLGQGRFALKARSSLSPRKSAAFRLLGLAVAAAVLLVVFTAAELVLRLCGLPAAADPSAAPPGQLESAKDPRLGWIFPASTEGVFRRGPGETVERTNSLGLRSPEIDAAGDGTTRILVTGDSFAFGWGVRESESFPRRLEAMLRERLPGRRIDVVNAAVPGYSVWQQRAMVERLAGEMRVDAVVSTFSLSNDPIDEVRIRRFAPDRLLEYSPRPMDAGSVLARAIGKSRVLGWIDLRTRGAQFQLGNVLPGAVSAAEASLGELIGSCHERGAPVLLVLVPRRSEIEGAGISRQAARLMTGGARRMWERVLERHAVPGVDLSEAVAAANARGPAYLLDDPHWTPAGSEAVARALVDPVMELLPAR
jgi:lysophospholipase L1-like esterase